MKLEVLQSACTSLQQLHMGAVSCSGTALSQWLVDTDSTVDKAYAVADDLNCVTDSTDEMLVCLKTAPLSQILKYQERFKKDRFLPTPDSMAKEPFIPLPPKMLYHKGYQKDVNYIIGYTESEASYEVAREFPNVLKYQHLDKMIGHFLIQHFKNSRNFEMIIIAAKYHYLRGIMIPTFESLEPLFAKMMTDFLYKSPIKQVVHLHLKKMSSKNIFAYKYKSKDEYKCGLENRRCYGNEYYLFKTYSNTSSEVDNGKKIETLSKVFGNFMEFGNPDGQGKWKPNKILDEFNYAEISDVIEPETNQPNDDIEFWNAIVSELNAAENITREEINSPAESEFSSIDSWGTAGLGVLCGVLCIALIGVVFITKKSTLTLTILPTSHKDTKFTNI